MRAVLQDLDKTPQPTHALSCGVAERQINSMALVRERTIPTERPPLVGEVSANFCG
jgi:hypothetical protein